MSAYTVKALREHSRVQSRARHGTWLNAWRRIAAPNWLGKLQTHYKYKTG